MEEPPTIITTTIERRVHADVGADGEECLPDIDDTLNEAAGPFVGSAFVNCTGELLSSGTGTALQDTQISSFSITGSGSVDADATVGSDPNAWVTLNVWSQLSVQFTVPVDAAMQLSGNFEITVGEDPDGTCGQDTGGWVFFTGTDTNGSQIFFNQTFDCEDPPEQASFFHSDTLKADTAAHLFIWVASGVMGVVGGDSPDLGQRSAQFDLTFDLGDRDGDGLLNIWEEQEGINVDADPDLEVDLSGANPDRKDLFVEIDVMAGVGFDQQAIDDVIRAFADAPAAMVDNPDGSKGIQLHVVRDGDRPAHQALVLTPSDDLPPEYYSTKNSFFGSAADRNQPNWNDIRDARLRAYRYCLWADTVDGTPPPDGAYGIAEGIPSNDFIIADGYLVDDFPDLLRENRASTFMHELGHTLGLGHGGQDDENNKPNYLSIMNYAYVSPVDEVTAQGTEVAPFWRLDFSRKTMIDLDETELYETDGLTGPAGRYVYYNSAEETDPDPVVRAVWWANETYVDWNGNSGTPKPDWYDLDITRNDVDEDPDYDSTLESFTDWDRLWYHLAGPDDFNDRARWPFARPAEGMHAATIQAFQNVEWVDLTALGDVIFENGFELGSTTAWSETVP